MEIEQEPLLVTHKRLALLAGRCARATAATVTLTPQRLDLLLRIRAMPLIQRDLAFELGVVRSVVSRMVTALEKLKLVERRYVEHDRRLRFVALTRAGYDVLLGLFDSYFPEGVGYSVQAAAEQDLYLRFSRELGGVGVGRLSTDDAAQLLRTMRATILDNDTEALSFMKREWPHVLCELPQPSPYLSYVPPRPPLQPHEEPPLFGFFGELDRQLFRRHHEVGLPLSARMRAYRKGRPPRPPRPPQRAAAA